MTTTATVGTAWVRLTRADLQALPDGPRKTELLEQHRKAAVLEARERKQDELRRIAEDLAHHRAQQHKALQQAAVEKAAAENLEAELDLAKNGRTYLTWADFTAGLLERCTDRDLWEQIHREADQMTKYNRPDVYDDNPETQARRRAQLLDAFYPPRRKQTA
jgi:hypothetical protein